MAATTITQSYDPLAHADDDLITLTSPRSPYIASHRWGIMAFDEQAGVMTLEEDQLRVRWPAPADEPDPTRMNE